MPRVRWKPVVFGAATFLAAHAIEVAARIGGADPWFISALPSALVTILSMFVAAFFIGLRATRRFADAYVGGLLLAAGAAPPLVVTLFTHPGGPGNLFPFAVILGVVVLTISSVGGAAAGWLLNRFLR